MKKILSLLLIITTFIFISCDYRKELSKNQCYETYNYINENFTLSNENDYLYYDYFTELLLINKEGQIYCNRELSFLENYNYNKRINDMLYIVSNYTPLDITGYKINTQIKYTLNVNYNYLLIEEERNLKISNCNLALYNNSNISFEMEICNDTATPYFIGLIIGNIELNKYNQYNLKTL